MTDAVPSGAAVPAATRAPRPRRRSSRRTFPWLVILLTSLVIAVYSPSQYMTGTLRSLGDTGLAGTYAERPVAVQIAFYAHIVFAGLALLVGGFQFSRRLRRKSLTAHRWVGRTSVPTFSTTRVHEEMP